jgi:hypothetical protein
VFCTINNTRIYQMYIEVSNIIHNDISDKGRFWLKFVNNKSWFCNEDKTTATSGLERLNDAIIMCFISVERSLILRILESTSLLKKRGDSLGVLEIYDE